LCALFSILVAAGVQAEDGTSRVIIDPASASVDVGHQVELLVDAQRDLTIHDVRRSAFSLVPADSGDINFGYSGAAYWMKLRLHLPAESGVAQVRRLLEVGYPSLDYVEFYVDDAQQPLRAGDRVAFAERVIPHRNFVFPVDIAAGQTATLILRVTSEGSLTVPLTLWEPEAFEQHNQRLYVTLGVYFGSLLAMLLYNLLLYLSIRQRSYLEYVGMLAWMIVGQLSLYGFGNQFLWGNGGRWGHIAIVVGFALSGMCSAMFTRSFLETRASTPLMDRLLAGFVSVFGAVALGVLFLPYAHFAIVLTGAGIVFAAVAIASGMLCMRVRAPGAGLYLLAWTMVLLGTAVLGARHHALLPTNVVTSHALLVGSALEMVLLSFALAARITTMRHEKTLAQEAALQANQALVESLHRSEQMLEARVIERTRELEIANRKLEESERSLHHAAHHDPLTGLANRLLLDDRIEQGIIRARRHNTRMAVVLIDLDGFKPVNDTHGHHAGDALLVEAGRRLKSVVREGDTVARVGGDEFVIVLENLFDDEHIERVMSALGDVFKHPFLIADERLCVGASIGRAIFPRDADTPDALLRQADAAMYAKKEAGRSANAAG
jgi:diguanylate cyclase (GGDEF)-like protein